MNNKCPNLFNDLPDSGLSNEQEQLIRTLQNEGKTAMFVRLIGFDKKTISHLFARSKLNKE